MDVAVVNQNYLNCVSGIREIVCLYSFVRGLAHKILTLIDIPVVKDYKINRAVI